jgi:hypothetical protein
MSARNEKGSHQAASLYRNPGRSGSGLAAHRAELLVETLDTASGVDNLLLAGVERVAERTDFNVKGFLHRRFGREGAATGAGHLNLVVIRMDIGFHLYSLSQATGGCGRSSKPVIIVE